MNHFGPQHPSTMHTPQQSRRHQEYHHYQQHVAPQSPGPHNPYAYTYQPQYYGQPMHMPYQPYQRWIPQQSYPPPYASYPAQMSMYNGPRSPMTTTSQPHISQYSQNSRHLPYNHAPLPSPSPYSAPLAQSPALSHPVSSPRQAPSQTSTPQPTSRRQSSVATQPAPEPGPAEPIPFSPPLPWFSTADGEESFPPRARRRRRKWQLYAVNDFLELPVRSIGQDSGSVDGTDKPEDGRLGPSTAVLSALQPGKSKSRESHEVQHDSSAISGDRQPSETTPAPQATTHIPFTRPIVPALPVVPQVASQRTKQTLPHEIETLPGHAQENGQQGTDASIAAPDLTDEIRGANSMSPTSPTAAAPRSWADLVRSKAATKSIDVSANGIPLTNGAASRGGTIGEVLSTFDVHQDYKTAFLEPRGLVNTGNMCYMNSILQVLVFCIPFHNFLDQVGRRAAHSFKSDTPLVDAMIMFMREYRVIDSAESVEKLRLRLKDNELEQYGEPLIPEYVYNAINTLPRFSSMRRGHQQDAEEFLGFLLAGLHDECVAVMRSQGTAAAGIDNPSSPTSSTSQNGDGWLEVGPKQKAAITRQAGDPSTSSPITRIFGGALRSELRVPGLKNSVTLEPYQPLQLDIGAPNISNIVDALKGLTKPESLTGDFNSPRGPGTTATKQVFIESLPPVLILHLKRFQYDSSGGTQKIWKRIGYPLQLEMPKEVFPPAKRGGLAVKGGLPRYRLVAVVYHHGKSAAGGHYTVDILRQDRREWIRIDDTFIRRIRAEQVSEAGADEDPKVLAKALERHQAEAELSANNNPYEGLGGEQDNEDGSKAWNDVNGSDAKRRWAGVAASAGTATPSSAAGKGTPRRDGVKDNKVAYILLYERISA